MFDPNRRKVSAGVGLALSVLCMLAMTAAGHNAAASDQPLAHAGWSYRVLRENLPAVDNLARAADGTLYATLELKQGAGRVIRVDRQGVTTLLSGLNRADGLLLRDDFLYITEEVDSGRVIEYDLRTSQSRTLVIVSRPEGIEMLPDGDLVISEDIDGGRLLRVPRDGTKPMQVLLSDLKRPEGLAIRSDGAILLAETGTGRVLSYHQGEVSVVIDDLSWPDQIEWTADGSLWITEDVRNGRLLRLKDGVLEVVVSGLRHPQGLVFDTDGSIYLAEQGRERILNIRSTIGR